MQAEIQQKLKSLIVEHGTSLLNDPRRIKAMLKDLFPQNKREVRVLSAVLDEGLAQRLLRDGDKVPTSISIPQYAQILHDDTGIDLVLAKWAVEMWAIALSLEMPKATPAPSDNTKAVLLLCAPLLIGKNTPMVDLLKPSEYNQLAKWLHEHQWQPADLIAENARAIIQACPVVMPERLSTLLGRGFQLSQALDQWASRSIWVMSRSDPAYPKRFKERLGKDAPVLLYACGNPALADDGGLAVVGSRKVTDDLLAYTRQVGQERAGAQEQIISGGAKGVDLSAMLGALESGGNVVGVLADSLSKTSIQREFCQGLMENRLLLLSHVDPNASFNVGMAMQRNKYIYALADKALVVNADLKKGGTWAGAEEQLTKYQFVPVYVRAIGELSPALTALQAMGAKRYEMSEEAPSVSTNVTTFGLIEKYKTQYRVVENRLI